MRCSRHGTLTTVILRKTTAFLSIHPASERYPAEATKTKGTKTLFIFEAPGGRATLV
jgi:hypothetical protein